MVVFEEIIQKCFIIKIWVQNLNELWLSIVEQIIYLRQFRVESQENGDNSIHLFPLKLRGKRSPLFLFKKKKHLQTICNFERKNIATQLSIILPKSAIFIFNVHYCTMQKKMKCTCMGNDTPSFQARTLTRRTKMFLKFFLFFENFYFYNMIELIKAPETFLCILKMFNNYGSCD